MCDKCVIEQQAERIAELEAENAVMRIQLDHIGKQHTVALDECHARGIANATLTAQLGTAREVAAYAWHLVNCDFRHCAFTADGDKCDEERAGHFAPHSHEFAPGECSCGLAQAEQALAAIGAAQDGATLTDEDRHGIAEIKATVPCDCSRCRARRTAQDEAEGGGE